MHLAPLIGNLGRGAAFSLGEGPIWQEQLCGSLRSQAITLSGLLVVAVALSLGCGHAPSPWQTIQALWVRC